MTPPSDTGKAKVAIVIPAWWKNNERCALRNQLRDTVFGESWLSQVDEAGCKPRDELLTEFDFSQQQTPGIGSNVASIKRRDDLPFLHILK